MTNWEANGHVRNDVTWLRQVKVVTPIHLETNISQMDGDAVFPDNYVQYSTQFHTYVYI